MNKQLKNKKLTHITWALLILLSLFNFSCETPLKGDGNGDSALTDHKEVLPNAAKKDVKHPYTIGNIAYNHSKKMMVDKASRFEVAITCQMDKQKLINQIQSFKDSSLLVVDSLQVTEYMKVKLMYDDSDFEVLDFQSETDGRQKVIIDSSSYNALWQWNVTPLRVQDSLPLSVKVWGEYGGEKFSIPVYDAFIRVESEEAPPTHWSVYALIGLISFILLALLFFFRKKKNFALDLPADKVDDIRALIIKGKIKQSIEDLLAIIPASNILVKKELTTLSARLSKIESKKTMNTISHERYDLELSRIIERILTILER